MRGSRTPRCRNSNTRRRGPAAHERVASGALTRVEPPLEVFCERAALWTEDDYLGPLHVQTADDTTEGTAPLPEWAPLLTVPDVYEKSVAQYAEPALGVPEGPRRVRRSSTRASERHGGAGGTRVVEAAYRSASDAGVKVTPSAL